MTMLAGGWRGCRKRHKLAGFCTRDLVRAVSSPILVLALLHACITPTCSHEGVNICAHDERPMTATARRLSCKQDDMCIHETQCGCIPKGCTCGDSHCIYAGEKHVGHGDEDKHEHDGEMHAHAGGDRPHHHAADGSIVYEEDSSALSSPIGKPATPGEQAAGKHDLVDDDGDGPMHTHHDGTEHGHPGGDMPHHHDEDGGLVFDMPKALPKRKAKFVMNKGPLLNPQKYRSEPTGHADSDAVDADALHDVVLPPKTGSGKREGIGDNGKGDDSGKPPVNGTVPLGNQTTSEMKQRMAGVLVLVLGMGIVALMVAACCTCFGSALMRCFKHKVLGKSMLSKDMFNDKEMMCMDWESKSNAAGWRHDDGL